MRANSLKAGLAVLVVTASFAAGQILARDWHNVPNGLCNEFMCYTKPGFDFSGNPVNCNFGTSWLGECWADLGPGCAYLVHRCYGQYINENGVYHLCRTDWHSKCVPQNPPE